MTVKAKEADRLQANEGRKGAASERPRGCRKQMYALKLEFNIFYCQQRLLRVTIVVPESSKPSEASGSSDHRHTPSTPASGASGALG